MSNNSSNSPSNALLRSTSDDSTVVLARFWGFVVKHEISDSLRHMRRLVSLPVKLLSASDSSVRLNSLIN